jgi:uncharacterized protein (TIGR02117 family)
MQFSLQELATRHPTITLNSMNARRWATFLALTVYLLIVSGCSTKPHVVETTEITVDSSVRIYVVRHGWHTGFVIPSEVIQSRLPELAERFGETPYMEFGWGDRAYYQSADKSLGITLRAVLWPSDAIVYTRAIPDQPRDYYPDAKVETLCLESRQFALLVNFIENSFYRDAAGDIVFSQDGLLENSLFFKGTGEYYLLNTCNTWTARGLKSAELEISPAFKVQAGSVMRSVARNMPRDQPACEAIAPVAAR